MRPPAALLLFAALAPAADPPRVDSTKEVVLKAVAAAEKKLAEGTPAKAELAKGYADIGALYLKLREPEKAAAAFTKSLDAADDAGVRDRRGDARLWAGQFAEAVADYDAYLKENPKAAPEHWRRGIALYYAGRYEDGVKQFDTHQTVNPQDVENAAWHYLCNVRGAGKEKAQGKLIDVTKDRRVPMAEIQKLFAGTLKPDDVLAAGDKVKGEGRTAARFYAHLYVALWYDAEGDAKKVAEHLTEAVEKCEVPDFMWDVANAHLSAARAKEKK